MKPERLTLRRKAKPSVQFSHVAGVSTLSNIAKLDMWLEDIRGEAMKEAYQDMLTFVKLFVRKSKTKEQLVKHLEGRIK